MSTVGQGTKCCRNIAENFNRLNRTHERYRQTDDRQTDGRQQIANVNVSLRSLKTDFQRINTGEGLNYKRTAPLSTPFLKSQTRHCDTDSSRVWSQLIYEAVLQRPRFPLDAMGASRLYIVILESAHCLSYHFSLPPR